MGQQKVLLLIGTVLQLILASMDGAGAGREEKVDFLPIKYEAEETTLTDLTISRAGPGYSGTGYVTGFTNNTGSVTFSVEVPATALYRLYIGYATPHGQKNTNLLVNGTFTGEVILRAVTGFAEVSAGNVFLNQGGNTITRKKDGAGMILIISGSTMRLNRGNIR